MIAKDPLDTVSLRGSPVSPDFVQRREAMKGDMKEAAIAGDWEQMAWLAKFGIKVPDGIALTLVDKDRVLQCKASKAVNL